MYILSKFVFALISPLGTALSVGLLALGLALLARPRLSAFCGALAVVWLGLWSLPVVSDWLRGTLERQSAVVSVPDVPEVEAIVVLGGGVTPPSIGGRLPNLEAGADRVWFGAQLFHAGKAPLVVLSGGSNPEFSAFSEAEAMAQLMVALGVGRDVLLLEEVSRNTSQNAAFTTALLAEVGVSRIVLVTSAVHMPRALARFEAEGLSVFAAATDYQALARPGWQRWLPDTRALDGSAKAIKEWVGLWVGR